MSNKAHVIYLNQKGYQSQIDALKFLGTVDNDSARDSLGPLVVGNTVVVASSGSQNNTPAFYEWNGSAWICIASNWIITQMSNLITDSYTASEIDTLFINLGFHAPVATPAALPTTGIVNGELCVVLNTGSGSMGLYIYKTNSWVQLLDDTLLTTIASINSTLTTLNAIAAQSQYWKAPVADETALAGLSGVLAYESHLVQSGFGGISLLYVNKNSTWIPYFGIINTTNASDLDALKSKLNTAQVDNAIAFVTSEESFYWYNRSITTWVKITDPSASIAFDSNRPVTRTTWPYGLTLGKTTLTDTMEALLFPPEVPIAALSIVGGNTREMGATTSVTLSYTATKKTYGLTTINVDGSLITPNTSVDQDSDTNGNSQTGTKAGTAAANIDTIFNMSVVDNQGNTGTSSATLQYRNKRFWFVTDQDLTAMTDSAISAVINGLTSSNYEFDGGNRQMTKTLSPSGQYIYMVWLQSYGGTPDDFVVNQLANNDWTTKDFAYQNVNGYSATFRLAKSNNQGNSTFTVTLN